VLGSDALQFPGLQPVLLSMREGEECLAMLGDARLTHTVGDGMDEDRMNPAAELLLNVTLHRWRRRDLIPVSMLDVAVNCAHDTNAPSIRKCQLRPGVVHCVVSDVGSVLVALTGGAVEKMILSWNVHEGVVPGYMEAAVGSLRMNEVASFDVPSGVVGHVPPCPTHEGQAPLRQIKLPELVPLLDVLLGGEPDAEDEPIPDCCLPVDWNEMGVPVSWEQLGIDKLEGELAYFRVVLLAQSERPDASLFNDEMQGLYLAQQRARGNALARVCRFVEAAAAYNRALDAVRRTPLYKKLFPTEHGRIKGAHSRDPDEGQNPLQQLDADEVHSRRTDLIALHLNLALCGLRTSDLASTRRHSTIVLGADPDNAKALYRRGSAATLQGDYERALPDLQRAAELQPHDRAIREELHELQGHIRSHREIEKTMFQKALKAPLDKLKGV